METAAGFEDLTRLMARLRAPDGCPWDREQTLESLRPFILEEAYELVDAIDSGDPRAIREETGDLLLEVVFVSQVAKEAGDFEIADAIDSIREKLVRRHPHVFARDEGVDAQDAEQALSKWEEMKAREKLTVSSELDGIPRSLPAMLRAKKLSARAARVGFDWQSTGDIKQKLAEELEELERAETAGSERALAEEIGDLFFVLVNLARHLDVDPEVALEATNRKFRDRFRFVERRLTEQGRGPAEATLEEMEALWEESKTREASPDGDGGASPESPHQE